MALLTEGEIRMVTDWLLQDGPWTKPRAVCSWCNTVVREGSPEAPVTHTICHECSKRLFDQMHAEVKG